MNNPEESAVAELGNFTSIVLNGFLDMQETAAALIRYSFQFRTIKDVVRRASENSDLIPQVFDQLNHLVIYLNEEIVETSSKAKPVGMDDRHFVELQKRMHLMYEVFLAMSVNKEYQSSELMKHVDASREAVKYTFGTCKPYYRWKSLSPELKEFFLGEKEEERSVIEEPEPAMFAREDGVVSSLAHEKAVSDEEGKKNQFVTKTEKVLCNYRAKNPDYKTMRELINTKMKFRLEGICCDNIIDQFLLSWDMAIGFDAVKPEEKYAFTALLKKVFLMMTDKRRNDFACKLYDKFKTDDIDALPCLENYIENFEEGLTEAVMKLPLTANVFSNNLNLFEEIKDPVIWHMLVSPVHTVQQLLIMCVDNKGYIPVVNRIFRCLPTLFERTVSVTPLCFESVKKEKLLITLLHRMVMIGRTTWTTVTEWENAEKIIISLAKQRKTKEGQADQFACNELVEPFSLVRLALIELLEKNRKPQKAVETFVKILRRLLIINSNARMVHNYQFATSLRNLGENMLPTPIIIQLMFELLVEYDGKSMEICECARDIIKAISTIMIKEKIVFENDTCRYLTEGNFNAAPWWIKYSIYTWLSLPLKRPKRQIPSGVYKTIPENNLDEFEEIKSEEVALMPECYLRSLFELGLFDVDLAIDLLKFGYGTKFEDLVVEKMAVALVDSYGKKLSRRNGELEIGKLIFAMLKTFDPIRELAPLKKYCSTYLESVTKIEHILVLFMAARIAKEKQLCAARYKIDECPQISNDELLSLKQVSEQLVDIFSETTKAHIENEVMEVENVRKAAENLISQPGTSPDQFKAMIEKEEREQSLALQLALIYNKCSHFCRLYQQVPIKLQQLMKSTLEKQFDSQKLLAKKVMDDVLTDQRKIEVVYAFAKMPTEPESRNNDIVQPVKPSELFPAKQSKSLPIVNEVFSTENVMCNVPDGVEYQTSQSGFRENTRRRFYENEIPTSSRGNCRYDRKNSFRGSHFRPVNDVQTFLPRDRDYVYRNTRYPDNQDYYRPHPRHENSWKSYDREKPYFNERKNPSCSEHVWKTNDMKRYSESLDSSYGNSCDNRSNRYPSESDYSPDECENRMLEQSIREIRNFQFHGKRQQCSSSRPGAPNSPYNEQKEEIKNRMKSGQPEREELAKALGIKDRSSIAPVNRRRVYNYH